jgi:hypothetical protein
MAFTFFHLVRILFLNMSKEYFSRCISASAKTIYMHANANANTNTTGFVLVNNLENSDSLYVSFHYIRLFFYEFYYQSVPYMGKMFIYIL